MSISVYLPYDGLVAYPGGFQLSYPGSQTGSVKASQSHGAIQGTSPHLHQFLLEPGNGKGNHINVNKASCIAAVNRCNRVAWGKDHLPGCLYPENKRHQLLVTRQRSGSSADHWALLWHRRLFPQQLTRPQMSSRFVLKNLLCFISSREQTFQVPNRSMKK